MELSKEEKRNDILNYIDQHKRGFITIEEQRARLKKQVELLELELSCWKEKLNELMEDK